ncbi:MAG: hypothetical protein PSX80_06580 [bacterium]|nr:hypothetical protein [bacterium]
MKELVTELDRDLLREHRFDTDLFAELTAIQKASGIMHGSRPISPFLRPYFLESSRYSAIRKAAHALTGAFTAVTAAALESPELMKILSLTGAEERFARFEPGYREVSVTSRLDTFLEEDGFKFLEYNAETPAGVGDQHRLEEMFTHVPLVGEFLARHPHFFPQPHVKLLEVLDRAYREFGGRKEKPNIAIVDWAGVDTAPEFEILREYFESCGNSTQILDPSELEFDGETLRSGHFAVDIFYKRLIIHEFLERCDETHPISRAVEAGKVCMANSFRSKIPHKKSSFAILSDDRFHRLFTSEQLDAIRDHIPWTRLVEDAGTSFEEEEVDLLELIRTRREICVLKPVDDYGGKGISFGWECTESEWDDAIKHALDVPFVVQQRAGVERTAIPVYREGEAAIEDLNVDFDPFLFMGEVDGGMVRLASGSLVNITQGGGETALAILDGF